MCRSTSKYWPARPQHLKSFVQDHWDSKTIGAKHDATQKDKGKVHGMYQALLAKCGFLRPWKPKLFAKSLGRHMNEAKSTCSAASSAFSASNQTPSHQAVQHEIISWAVLQDCEAYGRSTRSRNLLLKKLCQLTACVWRAIQFKDAISNVHSVACVLAIPFSDEAIGM